MNHYLFLSRKRHDELFDKDNALLRELFDRYSHKWSINGVVFYGVHDYNHDRVKAAIGE